MYDQLDVSLLSILTDELGCMYAMGRKVLGYNTWFSKD